MTDTDQLVQIGTRAHELMDRRLGPVGMSMLDEQLAKWDELNRARLHSPLRDALREGSDILPKGTLLHSTATSGGVLPDEVLEGVATYGLVSGDLIGHIEDGETSGCVDFFRVREEQTVGDYIGWAKERVRKELPEAGSLVKQKPESLVRRGITFIVDPATGGIEELLARDAYKDSDMSSFASTPSGRTAEDTAAILGAVPKGAIAGIILGEAIPIGEAERIGKTFGVPVFGPAGERMQLDDATSTG